MLYIERKFLLPIIVTISLFIAILGIGGPSYGKTFKNRFSPRTAVEIQVKETEGGVNKIGQVAEFCSSLFSFVPTASYIASFHNETRNAPSYLTTLIPARSPPLVN